MADSARFSEDEQKRMLKIGIPRRQREEISASDFDSQRPAAQEAARFFHRDDRRPFLVMVGAVGVGKSDAAANALMTVRSAARWVNVLVDGQPMQVPIGAAPPTAGWVHAFELVKASTFDGEFWAKVQRPELLVIDDLGTMPLDSKGYAVANLSNLLCYREAQDAKTLITANLTWEEFEADYLTGPGERVRDRMKRIDGMFYQVPGSSLRRSA